jgi:quercetin dioxygenase-like cupin family protein
MRTPDNLLVVAPNEGKSHGHILHKLEAKETDGRWGVAVVRGEKGGSGWTHIHQGEPEAFFVLEGDIELCGAESVTRIGPGHFVLVPPDTEHALRVLSDEARWLAIWPSALDGLVDALEEARARGEDSLASQAAIRARHGTVPGRRIPA